MDIYIKPNKKAVMKHKESVSVGDLCDVMVNDAKIKSSVKGITMFRKKEENLYVVSAFDIVSEIKKLHPSSTVNNLGEMNTLVEFYQGNDLDKSKWFMWLKVAIISVIIFAGCITAIITFHVESQVQQVFDVYTRILSVDNRRWFIEIPYSVGIAAGIIIFFNHIGGKKITNDPTPIEVEMNTYETEIYDAVVDSIEKQTEEEGGQ